MSKQRVFLTGATGGMGLASLKEMLKDADKQDIVILARDSEKNRKILAPYGNTAGLEIVWGDLNDYDVVLKCVKDCDLVLHIAAFVSPAADYHPRQAIAPACVGKRDAALTRRGRCKDHPRVCGEKVIDMSKDFSRLGSPPRVRGKVRVFVYIVQLFRITPACAGKRLSRTDCQPANQDHPRVCGEKYTGLTCI